MNVAPLDPYYHWLGIPAAQRPPRPHELLGVDETETDPSVIAAAAEKR